MHVSLTLVVSVLAIAATYAFYAVSMARRARATAAADPSRPPPGSGRKQSWTGAIAFVGVAVALIGALFIAERIEQSRHPAVKEHGNELQELAARVMSCPRMALTVAQEGSKRARIDGCGRSATFRWKQPFRTRGVPTWVQIDPDCTVDYLGFKLPCD